MSIKEKKRKFKILVILNGNMKPDQGHISGILRYEATHPELNFFIQSDHPSNRMFSAVSDWRPDGIIVSDYAIELGFNPLAYKSAKAVVAVMSPKTASPFTGMRFASVNLDNKSIGTEAARFLIRKGFRNFGFVGTPHVRKWSDDRLTGFKEELFRSGYPCIEYAMPDDMQNALGWGNEQKRMKQWLSSLPKPCGIMVSYDQRAKHILDTCRLHGISVPGHIGVISVDNEEFLCEHTRPTLTSIVPDFESCGYRSAELLDTLMQGKRANRYPELFGIKGIVERFSTSDFSGSARVVEMARDFMRMNFANDISLEDMAKASKVSVRVLQKRFQTACGRSPSEELRDIRLQHVTELLNRTETPIKEIGWLCGFKSEIHLKNLFKKHFDMTMREYRQQHT